MTLQLSQLGSEALDDPATHPDLVRRMLRDIAKCNRWLGGTLAMERGLSFLLGPRDRGKRFTLLDIGTGAADLPRAAVRWAARRDIALVPVGLERIPAAAAMARAAGVPTMLGCASALPVRAQSADIVLLSQVMHHLDAESAVQLLAGCQQIARRGVIVADLHRRWFAAPGFRAAAVIMGLHATTIADGITSLRRGYSSAELNDIGARAGVPLHVLATPGSRLVGWWRSDLSVQ